MTALIAISLPLGVSCLSYAAAKITHKIENKRKREADGRD